MATSDVPTQRAEEKVEECMKIILTHCLGSSKFYVGWVYERFMEERDLDVFKTTYRCLRKLLGHMHLIHGDIFEERGTGPETEGIDLVCRIIKDIEGFVDEIWEYVIRGQEVKLIAAQLAGELRYQTNELFEF